MNYMKGKFPHHAIVLFEEKSQKAPKYPNPTKSEGRKSLLSKKKRKLNCLLHRRTQSCHARPGERREARLGSPEGEKV